MNLDFNLTTVPKRWLLFGVTTFFCIVPAVLFFPALFLGKLIYGYDTVVLGMPLHAEVTRSLAAFQWPLWMPDVLGGMPGIASCNLWFAYPTALLGALARRRFEFMLGIDAAFHVAIAGIGMYLLLRRLGRSFSASLLGAFFFAVSGSEISQVFGGYFNFVEGIAWTPWAFWAAHKAIGERSWFAWGLCGGAFALQVLAGAAQLFTYTLAALACFAGSTSWNPGNFSPPSAQPRPGGGSTAKETALGLALALALAFLLAAPQLWPTLQYLPYSARQGYSHAQFIQGSILPSEALAWIVPGYFGWRWPTYHGGMSVCFTSQYMGLLPLCLGSGSLSALWRKDARVRWLAVLAAVAFFLAQNRWTPFYALFRHLPVLADFRIWSRTLFLFTFATCVLAAFGWDALWSKTTRSSTLRGSLVFLACALVLCASAWLAAPAQAAHGAATLLKLGYPSDAVTLAAGLTRQSRDSALNALGFATALFAFLYVSAKARHPGAALVAALAFHAMDQSSMINYFVTFMSPPTLEEAMHFRLPPPPQAGLEPWRVYDWDPLTPNNATQLGYENLSGSESVPLQSYQNIEMAMRKRRSDWLDLMNERYWFSHSKASGSRPGSQVTVYENQKAFPRAWLVGKSLWVSGDAEACRLLANPGFNPQDEVALSTDLGLDGKPARGSVLWLARSPQSFSLEVSSDRAAALVISNFWYPSWVAKVDGQQTPLLEADGGLQAIALSKGGHRVDLRFDPTLFDNALAACLAGLVLLAGLGWIEYET